MGLGIEARFRRSRSYWQKHLELSKKFQLDSIERLHQAPFGRIAVLGAGRLLDVPIEDYARRFSEIVLIDADPTLRFSWSAVKKRHAHVRCFFEDVSGCIQSWTDSLDLFLKTSRDETALVVFLEELTSPLMTAHSLTQESISSFDVVVSANLLSQIAIYWRDRFEVLLKRRWSIASDAEGRFSPHIEYALAESARKLQCAHLQSLAQCGARTVVLLTDLSFYYYTQDKALWQVEPALRLEEHEITIPGYTKRLSDSWLWHIIPQGIEEKDYGCIHEVRAYAFLEST